MVKITLKTWFVARLFLLKMSVVNEKATQNNLSVGNALTAGFRANDAIDAFL